jgi:serine/threonine protein kinase
MTSHHHLLIEPLGVGGTNSVIYSAVHRISGKIVAVKVSQDPSLQREFTLLSALGSHPNIIPVHTFFHTHSSFWLTLGLADCSLKEVLQFSPTLPQQATQELLVCVLRGLQLMHERGMVHGDIKPSNVVLTLAGDVHITDFSLSGPAGLGAGGGSVPYLSPEAVLGAPISTPSDVWGVGMVCLELCGALPPPTSVITSIFSVALNKPPVPPTFPNNPALSSSLAHFCSSALSKELHTRWTAPQLLNHPYLSSAKSTVENAEGASPAAALAVASVLDSIIKHRRATLAEGPPLFLEAGDLLPEATSSTSSLHLSSSAASSGSGGSGSAKEEDAPLKPLGCWVEEEGDKGTNHPQSERGGKGVLDSLDALEEGFRASLLALTETFERRRATLLGGRKQG